MAARDIDLDVMNFGDKNVEPSRDSVFWVRSSKDDNGAFMYYNGSSSTLINSLISVMSKYSDVYDLISSAVTLFEEDSMAIIEDPSDQDIEIQDLFDKLNVVANAIILEFAEITQMEFKGWKNHMPATEAMFDDHLVKFSDIVYFVETGQPQNMMNLFLENEYTDDFVKFCSDMEEDSVYCEHCDSIFGNNDADWLNDTRCMCPYCSSVVKI